MWTTVNTLSSEETYVVHTRRREPRTGDDQLEHPGSAGGLKSQYVVYDLMGRISEWSNPTEIDGTWAPAGDDVGGYIHSSQAFDWKGRPTVTYNQDYDPALNPGSKRQISYIGCGCAGGDIITTTDEVTRVQKTYRDVFGRVFKTEALKNGVVDTTALTTWDVLDQITEQKQSAAIGGAALTAAFDYDGYGRLWRRRLPIEGPDSLGTRFTYNDDDAVDTMTDPRGVITSYTYNARGLTQTVTFNTGGSQTIAPFGPLSFTYDENGNRLTMNDGAGSTTYHYDALSRMDWEKRHFNGLTPDFSLSYKYNPAGQVKEIKDHFNDVTYYNYDKTGRVSSVTGADLTRGEQYQFTSTAGNSPIKYRAWDGVKEMTYGNNIRHSLGYDARQRITSFEATGKVQGPDDPDPSPLVMKTGQEYYVDGQLRYVRDDKDSRFTRAYKWDHLGRLEEAYSGDEADLFAGKPPGTLPGPYRQSFQHDVFGHLTNRTTRYWSQDNTLTAVYDPVSGRNRNTGWQYDETGHVTQDENLKYFYNAAGLNWQAQNLAGAVQATREYDGDGNVVKWQGAYYLNATVLGGLPITEFGVLPGASPVKNYSNIYLRGARIAQLRDGTSFATPPDKWVIWDQVNPLTGSNGRSTEEAWYYKEAEPDPQGINVGFDDPFVPPDPPPDPNAERGIPALLRGPGETGKKCSLDGIIVDCGFVAPLIDGGAVVIAPPETTRYNAEKKTFEFFRAGLSGQTGWYTPVWENNQVVFDGVSSTFKPTIIGWEFRRAESISLIAGASILGMRMGRQASAEDIFNKSAALDTRPNSDGAYTLQAAKVALGNGPCEKLIAGIIKNSDPLKLLNELVSTNRIRVGDTQEIFGQEAIARTYPTAGHSYNSLIVLDAVNTMRGKEGIDVTRGHSKPGGNIQDWDRNILRAVILLHELAHATGAYYHAEYKDNKPPFAWSKKTPGPAWDSLDRLIFNTCFAGWRWQDGSTIQRVQQ
ncbi:MAG: hypothetical protein U0Z53_29640 [Blastocatellia bacterium]